MSSSFSTHRNSNIITPYIKPKEVFHFLDCLVMHLKTLNGVQKNHVASMAHLQDWKVFARDAQKIPPGLWKVWLMLMGRGSGKTRAGAETIKSWAEKSTQKRFCLLGNTMHDVMSVMLEGPSGLMSLQYSQNMQPKLLRSKRKVIFPNGNECLLYSAQNYEMLRGAQFHAAWVDELAKFDHAQEVWDQLALTMRLGQQPRIIVTTTPRPMRVLKNIINDPDTHVTRGSTFDNANFLSKNFIDSLARYQGTKIGMQEIEGLYIEPQTQGLWNIESIEKARLSPHELLEVHDMYFQRIVVAIDPAVTSNVSSDETGIIVAGLSTSGTAYVFEDGSGKYTPQDWATQAVHFFEQYNADVVVAEVNNGGDLVEHMLRSVAPHLSYQSVRASRGKYKRAEPVAALYHQGKIKHLRVFHELEQQMLQIDDAGGEGHKGDDRLDALVWALSFLFF